MNRNILAISGGGFSEEEDAFIDQYLLHIHRKSSPLNIGFIGTASNDAPGYIDKFYHAFQNEKPSHVTIQDLHSAHIQQTVNQLDVIYVGGGNTSYLLDVWRKANFDGVLKQAYEQGVVLAGISAGAMCWFNYCFSENSDGIYEEIKGLGWLGGCLCPHYNDFTRKNEFDTWVATKSNQLIYTLKDNENLHFTNEQLVAAITTM